MTRLILCTGTCAKTPYHFTMTGVNIYSIEELCLYLYDNIYMITEDMFSESLCDFMEHELNMEECSMRLREMIRVNASLKDKVVLILCSCDYYGESEIKQMLKIIDEISDLSQVKRAKLLADQCLSYKNYVEAKRRYQNVLHLPEAESLDDKDIGNIFHNLGIIALHLSSLEEAISLFELAYEHNRNRESLHQYLLALRLSQDEQRYQTALTQYNNGRGMEHKIKEEWTRMETDIQNTMDYKLLKSMEKLRQEGKNALYHREMGQMLHRFKVEYRKQHMLQEG